MEGLDALRKVLGPTSGMEPLADPLTLLRFYRLGVDLTFFFGRETCGKSMERVFFCRGKGRVFTGSV